jgi:tRNA(Ile)-lysidine synthase TilS/MesJ
MDGRWMKLSSVLGARIIVTLLKRLILGTYCGVFRRQALDRGSAMLGINHILTGHNADDMAETVLMNRNPSSLDLLTV